MGETMEDTAVISCAPRSVNVTVRKPSSRPREHLTERKVEELIDTAGVVSDNWRHPGMMTSADLSPFSVAAKLGPELTHRREGIQQARQRPLAAGAQLCFILIS